MLPIIYKISYEDLTSILTFDLFKSFNFFFNDLTVVSPKTKNVSFFNMENKKKLFRIKNRNSHLVYINSNTF